MPKKSMRKRFLAWQNKSCDRKFFAAGPHGWPWPWPVGRANLLTTPPRRNTMGSKPLSNRYSIFNFFIQHHYIAICDCLSFRECLYDYFVVSNFQMRISNFVGPIVVTSELHTGPVDRDELPIINSRPCV